MGLLRRVAAAAGAEAAATAVARATAAGGDAAAVRAAASAASAAVDRFAVVHHVCEETGVPEFLVRDDLPLDREALVAGFRERILGQDAVIEQMADLVLRIKAGLADEGRPLGAYLFIGPTGVGKTETVKALAALLYGRTDRILRFDMSEFGGPDCIDRLLGADATTGLCGRVAQAPFSVVLLDEVEKAHPAVFDLLLQVLGEARLSDRGGRVADFRNSIVLLTSNLGVGTFRRPAGFGGDVRPALRDHLLGEVHRFFRPELVGRLDAVVAFEPLGPAPIAHITHRELAAVARREGFFGRDVGLDLAEEVPGWLAERGVDLRYGARPLKRTIERELVAPVARALSERTQPPRAVRVALGDDGLRVRPSDDAAAQAARDEALRDALDTLAQLRYALGRLARVPRFRRNAHHLRLVDRLADSRAFWRDEALARERLAAVGPLRELVEAHRALTDQVDALEDLLLEAWAGLAPLEGARQLLGDVAQAERAFEGLEWTTAGIGTPTDAVTLWFCPASRSSRHHHQSMEPLILAYAAVAERRGWKLKLAMRAEVAWPEEPPLEEGERRVRPSRRRAPPPQEIDPLEVKRDGFAWKEHPHELETADALGTVLRKAPQAYAIVELRITGPHAATALLGEAGLHTLDDRHGNDDLAIVTRPGASDVDYPRVQLLRPPTAHPRQRLIQQARDRVRDFVLDHHSGIGRLDALLEGLLLARMRRALYGDVEEDA
ncbi:MAG: AAA family ATPase [Myxococcota bacterium]